MLDINCGGSMYVHHYARRADTVDRDVVCENLASAVTKSNLQVLNNLKCPLTFAKSVGFTS